MKTIEIFEQAIAKRFVSEQINPELVRAYAKSRHLGHETIDFDDAIWTTHIPEIVDTLRAEGYTEITISSTYSGLLEILQAFEDYGCKVKGLTKIYAGEEWTILPAEYITIYKPAMIVSL